MSVKCWIVGEGLAGTENQCIGIAEAMGIDYEVKRVTLRQPWKSLSPYLGHEQAWSFSPALAEPWPDLVIASGRKAIAPARYIKKKNPKTFVVFVQDPRTNPQQFDLVCVPEHDSLRGKNVLVTQASPNRITSARLNEARIMFAAFGSTPSPRCGVLIGGRSKAYRLTHETCLGLADDLLALDLPLMVTCSRRTGAKNEKLLREKFGDHYYWDGLGDNPYMAILAHADYLFVTCDSASMISDACSTGKPVYMIDLPGGGKRIEAFHRNLIRAGCLKRFTGTLEPYTYEPLNDAKMIAEEIQKCIQRS